MKKIAVVILNWNGAKLLQQFLPSVVAFSSEATIYIVDNASTDNSYLLINEQFTTVKWIQNTKNFGFAEGYNLGLQTIEEPIFALVNSDIEVTENWLQPIINLFEKEPETAIIQPKILDYKDKRKFEYAGAAGGFIDKYGFPFCRGRIFESIEEDNNQYNDEKAIFWASGACFFVRKQVFKTLKGFDADFFAHQEEIDFCWRSYNLGFQAKYTSKSTVYHVGGATLEASNPKKTYLNFRNSLFMLCKNLPKNQLFSILFLRMCLDGLAGIKFLLDRKPKHTFAIVKAHFSFYKNAHKMYKKRAKVQKSNYFKVKSIVWKYYISKEKTFKV